MKLTKTDLDVVRSFADRADESKSSRKLSHNGETLNGNWMGGNRIAQWVDGSSGAVVRFNDLGSKAAQTVQRALRKQLLPRQVEGSYSRKANPMGRGFEDAAETLFELGDQLSYLANGIAYLPDLSGQSQAVESQVLRNVAARCAVKVRKLANELLEDSAGL
jgi:hypothetical protein